MCEGPLQLTHDASTDELVIHDSDDLVELARFPRSRVFELDPDLMRQAAGAALDQVAADGGVGLADQLAAALNEGKIEIIAPPDGEWIRCHVDGFKLFACHRSCVVPGWVDG
jgi:hypothetical protein